MSPKSVSVTSIARSAGKGYVGDLKALFVVALVESTAFAVITLMIDKAVDLEGSSLLVVQGAGLSLSAGAWILSAFAAAEVGIHEQHSQETEYQRVLRRVGALLVLTLFVNALGIALTLVVSWILPSTLEAGGAGFLQLTFLFLAALSLLSLITNLAVSALMVEDCSVVTAWKRANELLPVEGTHRLAIGSVVVLVLPLLIGLAAGALIHAVTGAPDAAAEFAGSIASETLIGPFVAAFIVGTYVALRDRQVADAAERLATASATGQ